MGLCSKRHFLLTICTLQLITTVERQVFDFLGFMWVPILVNFFNIIFVILGFFGAFQYRPKYIISYCVWNALWFGWNVFLTCFYLSAGVLDKNSDILNLGTGSFSWWQINGPGCKPYYNNTVPDRPDVYRPARPDRVTGCVLDYEVIEVLHSSTQCLLAVMAVIGGVCLSRVFLEEDDSFDFVGGGDFGMAGHTPLHPMYVSYSALPAPGHHQHQAHSKHSASGDGGGADGDNYFYYPTNTGTTTDSHRSGSSTTLISPPPAPPPAPPRITDPRGPSKKAHWPPADSPVLPSERPRAVPRDARGASQQRPNEQEPPAPPTTTSVEYADYSNPIDQLPARSAAAAGRRALDYDTIERRTPDPSGGRPPRHYQRTPPSPPPASYSPLMGARNFSRAGAGAAAAATGRQNRHSYIRPRIYADRIRGEQQQQQLSSPPTPPPRPAVPGLRSFHSDPRLSLEGQEDGRAGRVGQEVSGGRAGRRDGRPLSMFINNY